MSETDFDVAIAGLGTMGSMAAWQLAGRGRRVIGFDRFRPPHAMGSHAGLTRIIREAYFEAPYYVPLVRRAFELWPVLERLGGRPIYQRTGGLMIGPRTGAVFRGARDSAMRHGLPTEELDSAALRTRFPAFAVGDDDVAIYEPRAGTLTPEAGIGAALDAARADGADLRFDEPITGWESSAGGIVVRTARGRYRAGRLILATGAWMADRLTRVDAPLRVARQVLFWLEPSAGRRAFQADRFPIFLWQWHPTRGTIYGFPDQGDGVKLAIHHEGRVVAPESVDRTVAPGEERALLAVIASRIPGAVGPVIRSAACLYTNTPDEDFIIDRHPADERVLVVSACSGHGYKFAPAIGELLADLSTPGAAPRFDLAPFRLDRPALRAGPRGPDPDPFVHPSL